MNGLEITMELLHFGIFSLVQQLLAESRENTAGKNKKHHLLR